MLPPDMRWAIPLASVDDVQERLGEYAYVRCHHCQMVVWTRNSFALNDYGGEAICAWCDLSWRGAGSWE